MSWAYAMSEPRPRDDRDAARDLARALAEIAAQFSHLKGDANAYLTDQNYSTLRLRLENAHAAVEAAMVEARRRVRLSEGTGAAVSAGGCGVRPPSPGPAHGSKHILRKAGRRT
jgi:hypothetical protein